MMHLGWEYSSVILIDYVHLDKQFQFVVDNSSANPDTSLNINMFCID